MHGDVLSPNKLLDGDIISPNKFWTEIYYLQIKDTREIYYLRIEAGKILSYFDEKNIFLSPKLQILEQIKNIIQRNKSINGHIFGG